MRCTKRAASPWLEDGQATQHQASAPLLARHKERQYGYSKSELFSRNWVEERVVVPDARDTERYPRKNYHCYVDYDSVQLARFDPRMLEL
jgi:hypothetical protein